MNAKLKSPEEALLRRLDAAGHSASLDLPERADGNPLKHRLLAIAGVGANVRTDDCDIEYPFAGRPIIWPGERAGQNGGSRMP